MLLRTSTVHGTLRACQSFAGCRTSIEEGRSYPTARGSDIVTKAVCYAKQCVCVCAYEEHTFLQGRALEVILQR